MARDKQISIGIFRNIIRYFDIMKYALRLSRSHKQPLISTLKRAWWLYREKRFFAEEAFNLGLFRLDLDQQALDCTISRRCQAQIQRKINPVSWSPMLNDKGIFYRSCLLEGLPIPELYAIYFKRTPGYCPSGMVLWDTSHWIDFMSSSLPDEFVVKPCVGFGGRGVVGFTRKTNHRFASSLGSEMAGRQIVEFMRDYQGSDGFVIQEKLRSHHQLVEMSSNSNLQTVRITTYLDRDNQFHILFSFFKMMTEDIVADNINDGFTSNIVNDICVKTGVIQQSYVKTRDGTGRKSISCHPGTGKPLKGFKLPLWDQACDLVRQATLSFLPIRTVGWDVALTDNGVRLLEGNIWWDRLAHDNSHIQILLNDLG